MPAKVYGEHYKFLPKSEILTFEEITRLASIFASMNVVKFRITGGEPLVRAGIEKLVSMLSALPYIEELALTTNAFLLDKKAKQLKKSGLHRVTVSLDSLDEKTYNQMSGVNHGPKPALNGIESAIKNQLTPVKINVVVQRGVNEKDIVPIAKYFKGSDVIVRFIEFMDVGNINQWNINKVVPAKEILDRLNSFAQLEPVSPDYIGEVAKRYRYTDGTGEIGIISSVSQPFCRDCTRARLTTVGGLVTCLFTSKSTDLRTPMRNGATDNELASIIQNVWKNRNDRYSEIRNYKKPEPKIEMYQLGG